MALEYENSGAFGAVHHLTVVCYMLQHNAYSRDVWLEARNMLAQFVEEGVSPAAMRGRNRSRFDSAHRSWSITKGAKLPEFETLLWSRTIAGVRLDDPETYCADVQLWATCVLKDTEQLVQGLKGKP